jgi:hypothetical protein
VRNSNLRSVVYINYNYSNLKCHIQFVGSKHVNYIKFLTEHWTENFVSSRHLDIEYAPLYYVKYNTLSVYITYAKILNRRLLKLSYFLMKGLCGCTTRRSCKDYIF